MLLVEDEALVAMMIQEMPRRIRLPGHRSRLHGIRGGGGRARTASFDAAVLDINLGDGLVYSVAEILSSTRRAVRLRHRLRCRQRRCPFRRHSGPAEADRTGHAAEDFRSAPRALCGPFSSVLSGASNTVPVEQQEDDVSLAPLKTLLNRPQRDPRAARKPSAAFPVRSAFAGPGFRETGFDAVGVVAGDENERHAASANISATDRPCRRRD